MSDNFVRAEEDTSANAQQTQPTQQTFSLNESTVNQSQVDSNQQQVSQLIKNEKVNIIKDRTESHQDDKNQKSFSNQKGAPKWDEKDKKIKEYFNAPKEIKSSLVYLDVETSGDLSFKLSDFEIVCFDMRVKEEKNQQDNKEDEKKEDEEVPKVMVTKVKGLRKISTEEYKEDDEKKKKFATKELLFKSQFEILKTENLKQLEKNPAADKKYTELELEHERVTRLVPSGDKTQIYLGTSFGRVVILNSENFEVQGVLQNILDSPVTDILQFQNQSNNEFMIFIGHEDGQLNQFTKEKSTQEYFRTEIIASTDFQERFKPKLKCQQNHRLIQLSSKPKYYDEKVNLCCSGCNNDFKEKEKWFHCMICKIDICCDCSTQEKFQKTQTLIEEKDKDGNKLKLTDKSKDKEISCNLCKQQNLQNQNKWYHCEKLKIDECLQCPSKWSSQESNSPKCCMDHDLVLIKEKKDEKDYQATCAECEEEDIQTSGLWYHCKDCKYDLCYYCLKFTPVRAMRYSRRHGFLFYVQQTKDYKSFLVCYDLKEKKEFGRETFNYMWYSNNLNYLHFYKVTNNFVVMISDNYKSFKCVSLEKKKSDDKMKFKEKGFQVEHQGPEKIIDSSIIVNIHVISEDLIIFGSYDEGCFCYNIKGNEVELDKITTPLFFFDHYCQIQDIKNKCKVLRFEQNYNEYSTQFFDNEDQLLFSPHERQTFFLKLQNLKFKINNQNQSFMTKDSEYIAVNYDNKIIIYDIAKRQELIRTTGQNLFSGSYNDFIYYQNDDDNLCRLDLKTKEIKEFKDTNGLIPQLSNDQSHLYFQKQNEKSKNWQLIKYSLETNEKYIYEQQNGDDFYFAVSNQNNCAILVTNKNKIRKLFIQGDKFQEDKNEVKNDLGWGWPKFSSDDKYFAFGPSSSKKVQLYETANMNLIQTIEGHSSNSVQYFFIKEHRFMTYDYNQFKCWDIKNKNNFSEIYSCKDNLEVIDGERKGSAGFLYKGEIKTWDDENILVQNFDNYFELMEQNKITKNLNKQPWIEGPLNCLHQEILFYFEKQDFEQKVKMLPFLLQFVVFPYRFTYFEKLVFDNKQKFIKEILKDKNAKYLVDVNGNHPLSYALKRQNYETINLLLDYFVENPNLYSLISFDNILDVLMISSSKLRDFFESSCVKIMEDKTLGKKKDNESDKYYIHDPSKALDEKKVEEKLCFVQKQTLEKYQIKQDQTQKKSDIIQDETEKRPDIIQDENEKNDEEQTIDSSDMLPVVYYQTKISLSLDSKKSTEFLEALDDCPQEEIFETTFVQKILEYKWILVKPVARFFLLFQSLFVILVTIHSLKPGIRYYLYILLCQSLLFLIIEFIILKESDYDFNQMRKTNLMIVLLTIIYCVRTLISIDFNVDALLPFINFFAWIGMILELQQFEKTREFVCVFFLCIESIRGFLIFLALMIFTFATTQNLLEKNDIRHANMKKYYGDDQNLSYDYSIYKESDSIMPLDVDLLNLWDKIFYTWIAIVKGDFDDNQKAMIRYQVFIFLLTFIANVTLLNLIVAIMSDAYGEVMTNITAKKSKSLNYSMVRYEKIQIWRKENSSPQCLIWVDYANEIVQKWKSQTDTIVTSIKKTQQDLEKLFKDVQASLIKSQQGTIQQIATTLQGRFDQLKTSFTEPIEELKHKVNQLYDNNQNQTKSVQIETSNAEKTLPIQQENMDEVKTQFTEMKTKQDEMKNQQDEMKTEVKEIKNSLTLLQEQTSLILAFMKEINNKTE